MFPLVPEIQRSMSADSSQGAFRGLRSRTPRSTSSPSTSTRERNPASPNNSRDSPSTYPHPLSHDYSPRPHRNSNLRHVLLTDALETPGHLSTSVASLSSSASSDEESDDLDVNDTPTRSATMSSGERPKLKLSFSKNRAPSLESVTSPAPQTILRTPSLKLHVRPEFTSETTKPTASAAAAAPPPPKKQRKAGANDATPGSSAKKRKQPDEDGSEDELSRKPAQVRKITLTTKSLTAQSPITPTLKIKHKGRIPKRPLGLGYDSELDEREADPTILESFILRMPPGPDADYLRDAVQHGTIGVARSQGGADIQMKFLDRSGRRGLIIIRGQRWAATLVDLPCIVEEKLTSENFIIKRENAQLEQKYNDVLAKNKRYREKDESSEKKIATHLAEIARLELRNRKTVQELDDTLTEVNRLKASKAVLEETCHKQCGEIIAGEKRFDDYIRAVTSLTLHFRRSSHDPKIHGSPALALRSEGEWNCGAENSRAADTNSFSSMPRTDGDITSPPRLQEADKKAEVTGIKSLPIIKLEHQEKHNYAMSKAIDATAFSNASRPDLEVLPSISSQVQVGHQSFSTTDERETPQRNLKAPEGCSTKRARLPDEELGSLVEKRMRQEHSRYDRRSPSKATDPRLQFRRR